MLKQTKNRGKKGVVESCGKKRMGVKKTILIKKRMERTL